MIRAAVLFDEKDRKLGSTRVPDSTFVIKHNGSFFFRTNDGVRLTGGGIGARFVEMDPLVRDKLESA